MMRSIVLRRYNEKPHRHAAASHCVPNKETVSGRVEHSVENNNDRAIR